MMPQSPTDTAMPRANARPLLVISACLLGDRVRYDGDHKLDALLTGLLSDHVQWSTICPEVELGLGVPREKIQLEGSGDHVQLLTRQSRQDLTGAMQDWARGWAGSQQQRGICGFILKSASPSCGIGDVKVWQERGFSKGGTGIFAARVMRDFPCCLLYTSPSPRD